MSAFNEICCERVMEKVSKENNDDEWDAEIDAIMNVNTVKCTEQCAKRRMMGSPCFCREEWNAEIDAIFNVNTVKCTEQCAKRRMMGSPCFCT